ncbi:MAG: hypothetical protein U0166_03230 [Acidobacteriota bacterium]
MKKHLAKRLELLLRKNVRLTLTSNRHDLILARPRGSTGYQLRLHRVFAGADVAVLTAIAMMVAGRLLPPSQEESLKDFLRRNRRRIRERRPGKQRRLILCPYGSHHDLVEIRDSVNRRYFGGRLNVGVTWTREAPRRPQKTISLGQYCYDRRVIFVHPSLDQRFVPRYVVENVLFHEMLHHEMGEKVIGGRRYVHTPEFRKAERRYRHFERAERWKDRHFDRLLRYRE